MPERLADKFSRCVKAVASTIKVRKGKAESAAIAICTKSVLHKRGKTIKRFYTKKGKPILKTQKKFRG